MRNYHVLIIPSWYPLTHNDNYGIFFREQAIALQNFGHKVGVIYPKIYSFRDFKKFLNKKNKIHEEIDNGVITLRSYGYSWLPKVPKFFNWLELRSGLHLYMTYVKKYGKPDLIHVHSMLNAGVIAKHIHELDHIPYVITEHSTHYSDRNYNTAQIKMSKEVATYASKRFGVSQALCNELRNILGKDVGSWIEMPNMVDDKFLEYDQTKIRKNNDFHFITVSSLEERKCIDNIIIAFAKVFKDTSSVKLLIAGKGDQLVYLKELSEKKNVSKQVIFLGELNRVEVVKSISDAEIFVLASKNETFGVVIVEALALGKPVIATRCGGPESIVREKDGQLVPVDDIHTLSKTMHEMYINYNVYNSDEIKESCKNRYSEKVIMKKWTDMYEKVLKKEI